MNILIMDKEVAKDEYIAIIKFVHFNQFQTNRFYQQIQINLNFSKINHFIQSFFEHFPLNFTFQVEVLQSLQLFSNFLSNTNFIFADLKVYSMVLDYINYFQLSYFHNSNYYSQDSQHFHYFIKEQSFCTKKLKFLLVIGSNLVLYKFLPNCDQGKAKQQLCLDCEA